MLKLTIKEHLEIDQQLITAKFSSLDMTKSVYFFWHTGYILSKTRVDSSNDLPVVSILSNQGKTGAPRI